MSYSDSDEDYYIDLFEKSPEPMANNYIPIDKLKVDPDSTEEYLNKTIGDVIGQVLEQCSRELPADPIRRLADLLELKHQDKEKEKEHSIDAKRTKSKRSKKRSESRKFETTATIAHNVVNIHTSANNKPGNISEASKEKERQSSFESLSKDKKEKERKSSSESISKTKKSELSSSSSRHKKYSGSSIIHDVAINNNESRSASSVTSFSNVAKTSRTSSSTTNQSDLDLNSTMSSLNSTNTSNKKQFSKRRRKKTPTVALPFEKYKEKRGIVQSSQSESNNGIKRESEVLINDNFDLQKHLKETKKNYKHLTSSK